MLITRFRSGHNYDSNDFEANAKAISLTRPLHDHAFRGYQLTAGDVVYLVFMDIIQSDTELV